MPWSLQYLAPDASLLQGSWGVPHPSDTRPTAFWVRGFQMGPPLSPVAPPPVISTSRVHRPSYSVQNSLLVTPHCTPPFLPDRQRVVPIFARITPRIGSSDFGLPMKTLPETTSGSIRIASASVTPFCPDDPQAYRRTVPKGL